MCILLKLVQHPTNFPMHVVTMMLDIINTVHTVTVPFHTRSLDHVDGSNISTRAYGGC